ncbi:MAG: TolC family protein [Hydrogenophilales bacterium CG17_big_fil_post_rev_8_21_14_2_50_63_12]|nr:MAG: TolC family protein [Hydrogenophilales bacterium CG17_big_fil_post_rev_8_21_14_2_50_63_12]PIX96260.1 MAG: TolC family protein [Hydrogenophilales bacterium CG_4_10_14_3_um_filter_63_21]PJB06230.1 MAG: TolC family protein [Hydrogenophilales bacterium CG_4_9_14_3_um_filter_63_34]
MNNRKWSQRVAITLAAVWVASPGWADKLEFKQCVETALTQNPDMDISRAQIDQAEAGVRQAQGNRLPRLNLSLTGTRSNDALNAFGMKLGQRGASFNDFGAGEFNPADLSVAPHNLNHPDAVNNFNSRIELQVPVYNGGLVQSHIDTAKANVRAAQSGDQAARQQLAKNILMAYQGVHTARANIKVTDEARAAAEEYVRITEKLHKQGMVVKSDVLSAKVNLEDVKVKAIEARNAEARALDQLAMMMGKPLEEPLDVGAPVAPALLAGNDHELRRQARENHAGLRALRNQLEGAAAQVGAARAGNQPQFNVMLRQDWNDSRLGLSAPAYTAAGVLSWTAFDGGVAHAGIDRAEAARSELAAKLRQAEDGIAFQVTDARREALEAEDKVAARAANLEQAKEAQRLIKKRYENGMGTLVELLAAQAQLDQANANLVASQYELAINRAELKRAVGVLAADTL